MKICLLTHTLPRFKEDTNSASFISELARGLVEEGHEVDVLTPYDTQFKKYNRGFNIITYKYIWPDSLHLSGYSRVLKEGSKLPFFVSLISIFMSISALIHLVYLSYKNKYDVVSAHWVIPNGFIAYIASFVTKVPYSVTIPGSDVYLGGKNTLFKKALKLACENASWVISDSNHYLKHMKSLGANPKQTSVIRYGVDTKFLSPKSKDKKLMSKLKLSRRDKIILALGRFVEKKGFIYLIEAMPEIIKKFSTAKLLIVGDGELRELYQDKINKLKISKYVIMPGAASFAKRNTYYNLSNVFVMPSTKDSKGNMDASPVAMMDAMCCGVPVVATKYSGDESIVDGINTGFIVKDKNSGEIAKAVIKILGWKDQSKKKKRIRKLAEDNFSVRSVAQKYAKIYERFV